MVEFTLLGKRYVMNKNQGARVLDPVTVFVTLVPAQAPQIQISLFENTPEQTVFLSLLLNDFQQLLNGHTNFSVVVQYLIKKMYLPLLNQVDIAILWLAGPANIPEQDSYQKLLGAVKQIPPTPSKVVQDPVIIESLGRVLRRIFNPKEKEKKTFPMSISICPHCGEETRLLRMADACFNCGIMFVINYITGEIKENAF